MTLYFIRASRIKRESNSNLKKVWPPTTRYGISASFRVSDGFKPQPLKLCFLLHETVLFIYNGQTRVMQDTKNTIKTQIITIPCQQLNPKKNSAKFSSIQIQFIHVIRKLTVDESYSLKTMNEQDVLIDFVEQSDR